MACESDNKGKCFTVIWKIENVRYCWENELISPPFTVDELHQTKWVLKLNFPPTENYISFFLNRMENNKSVEWLDIDCEFAFLSLDGAVLKSREDIKTLGMNVRIGAFCFACRSDVFFERKSEFLPQGVLTARCRIWKRASEMSKDVQCFARTRIVVEKRSFAWNIEDFSYLGLYDKKNYEIKSLKNNEQLLSLELFFTGGMVYDEKIHFKVIPNLRDIKVSSLQLFIVDASKYTVKCFEDEFSLREGCADKHFTLIHTKNDLMEMGSVYLSDDALSLSGEYAFCYGNVENEIEVANIDCIILGKKKSDNRTSDKENELPVPKSTLINDFKSMLNDSVHSDIKLKTENHTYPAHKCILSVRSPVFKAMFSNDMKEKNKECVDIEDLNGDTVLRMLRYIYSAEVEELDWTSATDLYEAADKYEILDLKDICSSFLKSNLGVKNACQALILSDLHQDEDLKSFVQKFIMSHGKNIINSEDWEHLEATNLKLAYGTVRLKFQE